MFFLSLLPLVSNIALPAIGLRGFLGQNCLFLQNSDEQAYLLSFNHIKACKSQYVKDCGTWLNSYQSEQRLNSRVNKRQISILK